MQKAKASVILKEVLIATPSPLLRRRLETPLQEAGCTTRWVPGPREILQSKRQRPWLACFLDARAQEWRSQAAECVRRRPGERYVLIRGAWEPGRGLPDLGEAAFGCLREPFSPEEVVLWYRRAFSEARLAQGEQSLEDLLYARFRAFLQNLGPASMTKVHDLIWERVERPLITSVLEWTGGNQTKAAEILGIHRNTLRAKIKELGLRKKG